LLRRLHFSLLMYWRRHCLSFHRASETPDRWSRARDLSDPRSRTCPCRSKNHGVCRKPERIAAAVLSSSYFRDRNPPLATPLSFAQLSLWLAPPGALGRKHRKAGTVSRRAITGAYAAPCVRTPSLTQGPAICLDRSANEADALWPDFPFQMLSHHFSICGAPCRSPFPFRASIRC
jgi:hypothetical protein